MLIYKYQLEITHIQVLSLPSTIEFMHLGVQNGTITFWVKVDTPTAENKDYTFIIVGTGHHAPQGIYMGTVQIDNYVWHVWREYQ